MGVSSGRTHWCCLTPSFAVNLTACFPLGLRQHLNNLITLIMIGASLFIKTPTKKLAWRATFWLHVLFVYLHFPISHSVFKTPLCLQICVCTSISIHHIIIQQSVSMCLSIPAQFKRFRERVTVSNHFVTSNTFKSLTYFQHCALFITTTIFSLFGSCFLFSH